MQCLPALQSEFLQYVWRHQKAPPHLKVKSLEWNKVETNKSSFHGLRVKAELFFSNVITG